jgi:hypothetical protein
MIITKEQVEMLTFDVAVPAHLNSACELRLNISKPKAILKEERETLFEKNLIHTYQQSF